MRWDDPKDDAQTYPWICEKGRKGNASQSTEDEDEKMVASRNERETERERKLTLKSFAASAQQYFYSVKTLVLTLSNSTTSSIFILFKYSNLMSSIPNGLHPFTLVDFFVIFLPSLSCS